MKKFLLSLALAVSLAGCASLPGGGSTPGQSPQQVVFAAKTAYAVALVAATEYKQLPACNTPVVLPCHDRDLLAQIQKADNVTSASLDAAESAVRTAAVSADAKSKAITVANTALAALQALTLNLPKKVSK